MTVPLILEDQGHRWTIIVDEFQVVEARTQHAIFFRLIDATVTRRTAHRQLAGRRP